ncbi:oxygen-independent coproporphyrinogen III oxidase [Rhizobium sp. PL01]|uniref:oxygen-independent coproporphyrinogen III oxidase n=1 Tax=Rhizobium sp. PL01 TaxID=3085631 RepID=UPI0029819E96|nr:oxygen-independent coproporphyrinogen III oxidase [Rhizobium sp. PL01]MDW5316742.1 oxygen-independent coproporphyrinogen III oxidase [Rhizobium sp. PL01]
MASNAALFDAKVPRYTSYPTAPHFHSGIGPEVARQWISSLPAGRAVSLYMHIPFCDRLCWFCACHTKQTLRYEPVSACLQVLHAEIAIISQILDGRVPVGSIHLGGGSPTMLRPDDLITLGNGLRNAFPILPDAEISIEIDPNDMDEARLDALAEFGMTRASLGIQDFDPRVQQAINRLQSVEQTAYVVDGTRARGIASVNLDLLYGLPHQTVKSASSTLRQALQLAPDRMALFGYAHVPWMKKHQTQIRDEWLPDGTERYAQAEAVRTLALEAGYEAIGIDHFALPGDALTLASQHGRLRRNFQGYSSDRCDVIIGLGPSAISQFEQGYLQNTSATGDYLRRIKDGDFATARGVALTDEDRVRRWVIEKLMCDFRFSNGEAIGRFGALAGDVMMQAKRLAATESEALCEWRNDVFEVTTKGRPFVRLIAARFDTYFTAATTRHSAAV